MQGRSVNMNLLMGSKSSSSSARSSSGWGHNHHHLTQEDLNLREKVSKAIHDSIQEMGKSGLMFEDGCKYNDDEKNAMDCMMIVEGKDPALASSSFASSGATVKRDLTIGVMHWVGSMRGFKHVPPYGVAYVHTDGSITLASPGSNVQCRCKAVHQF